MRDLGARTKIWDPVVRLTHWLLVVGVVAAFVTQAIDRLDIHLWVGVGLLTLVIFRLLWGLVGSTTARFSHFLKGPSALMAYVKNWRTTKGTYWIGHNPVGGWASLLLMLAILVQASSGLFTHDDVLFDAPLSKLVSEDVSTQITKFHETWFFVAVLGLVLVHITAIVIYRVYKRTDLIRPMITGQAPVGPDTAAHLHFPSLWRALACLVLAVGIVRLILSFG